MFIFYSYPTPTLSSSPKQHFLNTSGVILFLCLCSNHLSPPEMPSPFLIYVWLFFQYLNCTSSMRSFPEHPTFNDNALLWTTIVVIIYPLFMPLCISVTVFYFCKKFVRALNSALSTVANRCFTYILIKHSIMYSLCIIYPQ